MRQAVSEIGTTSPMLEQIASYHMGWRNSDLTSISGTLPNTGKRIRPRLAILVAAALEADPVLAAPVAAAIELLHNFTLVHDDIQDRSQLRRHRPTVWALWGDAQAINVGDALFASAHLALYATAERAETAALLHPLVVAFDRTTMAIVGGQTMDIENEGDSSVTPERYLQTITGKTSAIVEFAAWSGGLLAGADATQTGSLADFGMATGLAFQIRDDLLGIWGTEAETGKTPADDLRRRKRTLPILELSRTLSAAERAHLETFYEAPVASEAEVHHVLALLDRYGIHDTVEREIRAYHDKAAAALESVVSWGDNAAAAQLFALLDGLKHRSG